jgi:hypothetical protein
MGKRAIGGARPCVDLERARHKIRSWAYENTRVCPVRTVSGFSPTLDLALPGLAAVLEQMVFVKPATVVQCHLQGLRLCCAGAQGRRPSGREVRDLLIRQMNSASPSRVRRVSTASS